MQRWRPRCGALLLHPRLAEWRIAIQNFYESIVTFALPARQNRRIAGAVDSCPNLERGEAQTLQRRKDFTDLQCINERGVRDAANRRIP
jgi:hypothetical protein